MRYVTAILIGSIFLFGACSTTKNLPEGEVLYTGQKKMVVENRSSTPVGLNAMEEIEAALAKAPNNSFLGSSVYRTPFPVGLWFYNSFVKSNGKFGKFMFKHFAAEPVFISTVNPGIRAKVATNILHDTTVVFKGLVHLFMDTNYTKKNDTAKSFLKKFISFATFRYPCASNNENRSLFIKKG